MSSVKVEAAATNAVRNLINLSNSMTSDEIKEGDRGVSFDGCIPIYLKNKIKKENFCNKIVTCYFPETWYSVSGRRMEWSMISRRTRRFRSLAQWTRIRPGGSS